MILLYGGGMRFCNMQAEWVQQKKALVTKNKAVMTIWEASIKISWVWRVIFFFFTLFSYVLFFFEV